MFAPSVLRSPGLPPTPHQRRRAHRRRRAVVAVRDVLRGLPLWATSVRPAVRQTPCSFFVAHWTSGLHNRTPIIVTSQSTTQPHHSFLPDSDPLASVFRSVGLLRRDADIELGRTPGGPPTPSTSVSTLVAPASNHTTGSALVPDARPRRSRVLPDWPDRQTVVALGPHLILVAVIFVALALVFYLYGTGRIRNLAWETLRRAAGCSGREASEEGAFATCLFSGRRH